MSKKVSVIVAAYNAEKTIARCIDSVLTQTYKDFELIIVNDGSMDGTEEICSQYEKDSRIVYIYQSNKGEGGARNTGLSIQTGELVVFLDSDDSLPENALEIYIKQKDYDCIIGGYINETINGKVNVLLPHQVVVLKKGEIENAFTDKKFFHFLNGIRSKAFKSSIIRENSICFRDLKVGADTDFLVKYYAKASSIAVIREVTYKVYATPGSASLRGIPDAWYCESSIYEDTVEAFAMRENSNQCQKLIMRAIRSSLIYTARCGLRVFSDTCLSITNYIKNNSITIEKRNMTTNDLVIMSLIRCPIVLYCVTKVRSAFL